jgi:hypothetical protein
MDSPLPKRHLKSLSLNGESALSRSVPSSPRGDTPTAKNRKRLSLQADSPVFAASPTRGSYSQEGWTASPSRRAYSKSPIKSSISYASVTPIEPTPSLSSSLSDDSRSTPSDYGEGTSKCTLLEQHGDLLSIIARKERRCLELREGAQAILAENQADFAQRRATTK